MLDLLQTSSNLKVTVLIGVIGVLIFFKISPKFRYYFKFMFYCLYISTATAIFLPFLFIVPKKHRYLNIFLPALSPLSKILGIQWEVTGKEVLKNDFPCVVVSNHQTILDGLAVGEVMSLMREGKLVIVAKREIIYVFPFGFVLWLCGTIFVDRSNGAEARAKLNAKMESHSQNNVWNINSCAARTLHMADSIKCDENSSNLLLRRTKNDKTLNTFTNSFAAKTSVLATTNATLWVFPEGTRKKESSLQPFKKGAFHIALQHKLPIVPVVISPYTFIDDDRPRFDSGKILMSILEPIPTTNMETHNLNELVESTQSIMESEFQRLNKRVLEQ